MTPEMCRNCKYYFLEWENTESDDDGSDLTEGGYSAECRRYPPVRGDKSYYGEMARSDTLYEQFSGPIVHAHGWCGEWRNRQPT